MKISSMKIFNVDRSPAMAFHIALAVVDNMGFKVRKCDFKKGRIEASSEVSFTSWGEEVVVSIKSEKDCNSIITVSSHSNLLFLGSKSDRLIEDSFMKRILSNTIVAVY